MASEDGELETRPNSERVSLSLLLNKHSDSLPSEQGFEETETDNEVPLCLRNAVNSRDNCGLSPSSLGPVVSDADALDKSRLQSPSSCSHNRDELVLGERELPFRVQVDKLRDQLSQFQTHAVRLERELQHTRQQIDVLRVNATYFARLHSNGDCQCQKLLSECTQQSSTTPPSNEASEICLKSDRHSTEEECYKSRDVHDDMEIQSGSSRNKYHTEIKRNVHTSDSRIKKAQVPRYWTAEEHRRFLEALSQFGHRDLKAISSYVGTRSIIQCRTHLQKYFMRIAREASQSTMEDSLEDRHRVNEMKVKHSSSCITREAQASTMEKLPSSSTQIDTVQREHDRFGHIGRSTTANDELSMKQVSEGSLDGVYLLSSLADDNSR
eukprot:jgi/Galph1/1280/GphlegSOOS_G6103.1